MLKRIEKLQYITHASPSLNHCELAQQACKGGIKWVQLRVKDQNSETWLETAKRAKDICAKHGAVLIVNDSVEIAKQVGADGVHLGKSDMCPVEARQVLGKNCIIGGTANTFEDVQNAVKKGVDYVGLGPFRFTITKENLSPILALEGYREIVNACQEHGITVPLVAIGGIRIEDVEEIFQTGVHGVAIGTAIGLGDPINNAQKFVEVVY